MFNDITTYAALRLRFGTRDGSTEMDPFSSSARRSNPTQ